MKKVRMMCMVALFSLALMLIPNVNANASTTFPDVPSTLDGSKEIYYLVDKGVINGIPVNNGYVFKPTDPVTKGQAAKMVVIAGGYEPLVVTTSSFTDIELPRKAVLSGYVERAVQLGFFNTITDGKFRPDDALTRGEMSKVLATALKLDVEKYSSLESPFSDITTDNPYHKYISALYYDGITNGVSAGTVKKFNTTGQLSRREFSMFVARALSNEFKLTVGEVAGAHVPNEADYIGKVKSTTDYLNVRSSKSTTDKSNVVGQVNEGYAFDAYGSEGEWIKVVYEGKYAYISSEYAQFVDQNGNPLGSTVKSVVVTSPANIRVKSDEYAKNIGSIYSGTTIDVYGETNGWYLTKINGIPGYIKISQTNGSGTTEEQPSDTDVNQNQEETVVAKLIGRATTNSINVRSQPNTTSSVLGVLNRGDEVTVLSTNGFWAHILYKGNEAYVHKTYLKLINQTGSPVAGRIIVLDPGHGGKDPGATSGSYQEKQVALAVANVVKQKLEKDGAIVYMTRIGDSYPTLEDRVAFADKHYAEMFISIHNNSSTSSSAHGTETYYSISANDNEKEDNALATYVNSQIVKNAQMFNRGIKREDFYVIRHSVYPSILVELGFISNTEDRNKLVSSQYTQIFGDSIYKGIVEYYSK
ncbi:MAG TPA: N-acetylmuramoyl-L-alanine amidase [Ureibacillus sp.]|nr:N-acetylmuramoyl-L-alanine amidase [Ureibacillus sp.]